MNIYLQKIVESINNDQLSADWSGFDFEKFSRDKKLYDFQQTAVLNAIKSLWLFYEDKNGNKDEVYDIYLNSGMKEIENHLFYGSSKQESKALKILEDFYPIEEGKISFKHFINRMCFWMATGSGKSLVIIKLIEILNKLIKNGKLENKDILFLTYRDDLIEQFINHVDEFNRFNTDTKIILKSLKEYDSVKNEKKLGYYNNEITVFYYRSDLISDSRSEKYVDFKDYGEDGNWYLFLDEAHKGDREESKRQCYYSILSRNGYMFNFSATFTDIRDFVTCALEYNLASFIENGYGKHIYISTEDMQILKDNENDFYDEDKKKIFLKSLILMTYIRKQYESIHNINKKMYHKPLMVNLVNSVNIEDSDLQMVFSEIEKIGKGEISKNTLKIAIKELIEEYGEIKYEFEDTMLKIKKENLEEINLEDVLKRVFNSESKGGVEVLKIPGNDKELIFKLKTADKPFMLSKTGDIYTLLKQHFSTYEINESYDNESEFKKINNDDSEINILLGSRAFYEGWDSNRPNIINFINIGGSDAKKFVLQSVGRGVRIEPFKNIRKRKEKIYLRLSEEQKKDIDKAEDKIKPLETLFVYGTNKEGLEKVIATLREEKKQVSIGEEFLFNEDIKGKLLLIPVVNESEKLLIDEKDIKYPITDDDYNSTKKYFNYIGEKVSLMKFDVEPVVLERTLDGFTNEKTKYFQSGEKTLGRPDITIKRILNFLSLKNKNIDGFKKLNDEIIHFKHIKVDEDKKDDIIKSIKQVLDYSEKQKAIYLAKKEFEKEKDIDEYTKKIQIIEDSYKKESYYKELRFKHLLNHYYLPIVISDEEKINYITHIIKVKSEVKFMEDLDEYINKHQGIFKKYDWWLFSKIDQTLDKISIPYYNPHLNKIVPYYFDFIFWLQKGKNYKLIFVDPKGTAHTDYEHKVNGFKMLFEDKKFKFNNDFNVEVKLLLRPINYNLVSDEYKKYWFNDISELEKI